MKTGRAIVIALALGVGSCVVATAQPPQLGWQYQDRDHDRHGDAYSRDNGDRDRGGYGNAQNTARQIGFQDGLNDGARDRQTGHSFRPTQDRNFKHADRGYSGFVSKDQYKDWYRQAYESGYQRGYSGGRDRDGDYDRR